ncbi:hypothetical protein ACSQ67_007738 [Phaseolus vulgaris]
MSLFPKTEKNDVLVVDIDSESEDGDTVVSTIKDELSQKIPSSQVELVQQETPVSSSALSVPDGRFRSFWKAGDFVVGPSSKPAPFQGHLEHARVHPKFLHSNATSHKWAFGAIAELVDNAVDEIQNGATFVKIDKFDVKKDNSPALCFLDDGGGMDPNSIRKCMSLGYSSKKSKTTIGQYGNGFKTSTMRLGADAIVFSRARHSGKMVASIDGYPASDPGNTKCGSTILYFLRRTGQDDVVVPMIDFDISGHWAEPIIYSSQDEWSANLKTILDWSPFTSKEELMLQFDDIGSHGTKVLIYNLWLNDEGIYELSFDDDVENDSLPMEEAILQEKILVMVINNCGSWAEDIMLRDEANHGAEKKLNKKTVQLQSHISYRIRYSLRAIAETKTTIGFIKEAASIKVTGFNVYHKNRLIKPFWKVVSDGSSKGSCVVGMFFCSSHLLSLHMLTPQFPEPAHDKQDFERSVLFIRLENKLKQMTMDYWKGHCHLIGYQPQIFKSQNLVKEAQIRKSAELSTNPQNELPSDQQVTGVVPQHPNTLSLNQTIVGLDVTGMQDLSRKQILFHRPFSSIFISDIKFLKPQGQAPIEAEILLGLDQCGRTFGGLGLPAIIAVVEEYELILIISIFTTRERKGTMVGTPQSVSVDEICAENIQLFERCEEYRLKETELKKTVVVLEEEYKQIQKKCAVLASLLEIKRKEKYVKG